MNEKWIVRIFTGQFIGSVEIIEGTTFQGPEPDVRQLVQDFVTEKATLVVDVTRILE